MADILALSRPARVPSSTFFVFVALTFAITWGLVGFYIAKPEQAAALLGELSGSHPVFIAATWGPAIAAFILTLWISGFSGFRRYLTRLFLWRCPPAWVAFVIIGVPLTFAAGALVKGNLWTNPIPSGGIGALLVVMAFMMILGPVEEFGWRGLAQPILQRHVAPLFAGLLIGATWGIWHLPAFYLSGTVQSGWSFTPFFFGNIALAVIVTPLFNASKGSILWPMLFHYQLINPLWSDAQPYDIYFFLVVAVGITWLNRDTMFSRAGAVTEVIPGEGGGTQ